MRVHFFLVRVIGPFDISHRILHAQINTSAHPLHHKCRLISCNSVQQYCHRRMEHLFYAATATQFYKPLLIRTQITYASAHVMNFTAAHRLNTPS